MNSIVVVFAASLALANAGFVAHSVIGPIAHGATLQGPGTKTTLVGPDGSHIVASAPGGVVSTSVDSGYLAHSAHVAPIAVAHAPVVAHHGVIAHSAPIIAHHELVAPVVSHHGVIAHSAPVIAHHGIIAHAAPVVAHHEVVSHHSSVVAHSAPIVAPAVVAHVAPEATHAAVVGHAVPVHHVNSAFVAHGPHGALIAPGTGIGGQYEHDYSEVHYDDGTYKGEFYGHHH